MAKTPSYLQLDHLQLISWGSGGSLSRRVPSPPFTKETGDYFPWERLDLFTPLPENLTISHSISTSCPCYNAGSANTIFSQTRPHLQYIPGRSCVCTRRETRILQSLERREAIRTGRLSMWYPLCHLSHARARAPSPQSHSASSARQYWWGIEVLLQAFFSR